MNLQRQIARACKIAPYRKAKRNEKITTGFDQHIKIEKNNTLIKLYGKNFNLDKSLYRLVARTTYKRHFAYKVYDKMRGFYQLYVPFLDKLIKV